MNFVARDHFIYAYHDGTYAADGSPRRVHADPMVLYRKWRKALAEEPGLEPNLKRLGFTDPEEEADKAPPSDDLLLDARTKVCPAIRTAFGVPEFGQDDTGRPLGLTEDELLLLLQDFWGWLDETKKVPGSSPSSSTSTPDSASGSSVTVDATLPTSSTTAPTSAST